MCRYAVLFWGMPRTSSPTPAVKKERVYVQLEARDHLDALNKCYETHESIEGFQAVREQT